MILLYKRNNVLRKINVVYFIWFKNKLYDLVIKDVTTIIYADGIYELLSFELTFVGLLLTLACYKF
jgi:hypothetical protein